jgi:AGCS family alanine or glycine:cation symporter
MFSLSGLVGVLPLFNVNQLTQAINDILLIPSGLTISFSSNIIIGFILIVVTSLVILGGLKRISLVATKLVPFMVAIYMLCVMFILIINIDVLPTYLKMIFTDAFVAENYNGEQVYGGVLGALIILGIRRGAFSNEAGIGELVLAAP